MPLKGSYTSKDQKIQAGVQFSRQGVLRKTSFSSGSAFARLYLCCIVQIRNFLVRAVVPSTYILASRSETPPSGTPPLLPIPLPTPSPPLLLPSTDCRAGVSEVTLPLRKRLCIALGLRFEGTPAMTDVAGISQWMTDFITSVREDTDEIYGRLDDAQDDRLLMSGQLNMLRRE
ncbi:hypothetical protein Tco_0831036 [Tanacetum coccineum]